MLEVFLLFIFISSIYKITKRLFKWLLFTEFKNLVNIWRSLLYKYVFLHILIYFQDLKCYQKYRKIELDFTNYKYPNTWYPILESRSLKRNDVKSIRVFGKDLIAFRGISGKAYVLDAYCPHLGAHLAVGGTVVGDHIRCPFHGWTFDGSGVCTAVPGVESNYIYNIFINLIFGYLISGSKLPKAEINVWRCSDLNGFIYVWYHMNGENPKWFPKEFTEFSANEMTFRGRIKFYCNTNFHVS